MLSDETIDGNNTENGSRCGVFNDDVNNEFAIEESHRCHQLINRIWILSHYMMMGYQYTSLVLIMSTIVLRRVFRDYH